jgi:glucuronoarabinoxylan endo-1,4-beta-xylanase
MDGFGAADVWTPGGALSATQGKLFFDPISGIGLSILRVGIDTTGAILGGAAAYSDIKMAASYGAIVWGAPWSPPAASKDNGSADNGGHLCAMSGQGSCTGNDYSSWAATLAGFPATVKAATGVQLYAVSAQNEPDYSASYASCLYNSAQMVSFVKVLGPMLSSLNPPVKLLAAEPDSWSNLWSGDNYGTAILADSAASSAVNIIATHDYGHKTDSVATRPPPPSGVTQHIWETEMSDETAPDPDIAHGIQVATWVYAGVTTGGASAWHYWWLVNSNTDGEGLLLQGGSTTNPPKRVYTLGNFSKFVRPGYVRVDAAGTAPPAGVLVAAFENPLDATTVIVAINSNTSATTVPLFVRGTSWPSQVTPWVTSANDNLASQTAITLSGGNFSATLGAQTVTTFVGKP